MNELLHEHCICNVVTYRLRFPNIDGCVSGGGGGMQFASLMSASSRRLAAIVENLARVSGVILFIVLKARAACSNAGFFCIKAKSDN